MRLALREAIKRALPNSVREALVSARAVEIANVFLNSLGKSAIIKDYELIE